MNRGMTFSEAIVVLLLGYVLFTQGFGAFAHMLLWIAIGGGIGLVVASIAFKIADYYDGPVILAILSLPFVGIAWLGEKMQRRIWGEYKEDNSHVHTD